MLSIIFFAFSLSLDAFGYSLGFGSRNVKLSPIDFLIINILNALILCLFFEIYNFIELANFRVFLNSFGNYILLAFGFYYILLALKEQFFGLKTKVASKINFKNQNFSQLTPLDFILLLSIFVVENIVAVIIFCSNFVGKFYFVAFIFLFHMLFFLLGFYMGNKMAKIFSVDSSFLSGAIFVVLALINF